jgi:hypothetical protein
MTRSAAVLAAILITWAVIVATEAAWTAGYESGYRDGFDSCRVMIDESRIVREAFEGVE